MITGLKRLDAEMDALIQEAHRPGTRSNLRTQVSAYYQFCNIYKLNYLPANNLQLTRFAVFLHLHRNLKPDTINNYISGVRTLHGLAGFVLPKDDGIIHGTVLKGIKNRNKTPRKQAEAITPQILKLIFQQVDTSDVLELVAWVAILIGFHCLLRASNLTPRSVSAFNLQENLLRQDFRMHGNLLLVHIKWTKTLQYREKKLLIPVIPFLDAEINAVTWFHTMISTVAAPPTAPAFSIPKNGEFVPLTYPQLAKKLRKWTENSNLDPKKFTSHCLRRGGASWLDEQGVPESVIAVLGDWRTTAFKAYIDSALKTRMRAMIMFANANEKTFD